MDQDALCSPQEPPASQQGMAAEMQRGLTFWPPELFHLTSGPRRNQATCQHSCTLCTGFCFGQKSPFSNVAWEKTTPLFTWQKGCKASSSSSADWATRSLQGHVLDISALRTSLWWPTQAENPHEQAVLGMTLPT